MQKFRAASFLFILLGLSVYSYVFYKQDHEWVIPHMNDRTPAAVRDSQTFQDVVEKPTRVFKRESVARSIRIRKNKMYTYFAMGQFAVDVPDGKNIICLEYPYVRLKFVAEGQSVGEVKPTAWVSAPCSIDEKNKDYISKIPLPFDQLGRWPAQDQEVEYQPNGSVIDVRFESILGEWPDMWKLESVEFTKSSSFDGSSYTISNKELLEKLGRGILVTSD